MNQVKKLFKAYFIDLDGTALDISKKHKYDKRYMSDTNKNHVRLVNQERPIIISSGRGTPDVLPLVQELKLQYGVAQNGARIFNQSGKILREINIDNQTGLKLIKYFFKHKFTVRVNDDNKVYSSQTLLRFTSRMFNYTADKPDSFQPYDHYSKLCVLGRNKFKMNQLFKTIQTMNLPISIVTSEKGFVIEITGKGATKGQAALWVLERLKIKPQEAAHIGDTMNDVPAFLVLGGGIAMDNSSREVKKYANYIAPHFQEGGLVAALNGEITPKL